MMDTMEVEVLGAVQTWVKENQAVLMATVVATWGSSPRPKGSLFAVSADGRSVGSVSGGCIEDYIINDVRTIGFLGRYPQVVRYGVTAEEAHRFGLPCGGTIELVVEVVRDEKVLNHLLSEIKCRRLISRRLNMQTGQVLLERATATDSLSFDGSELVTVHGPSYRLLLIGAGQLSYYVSMIAITLGFSVTVCDPREEYFDHWTVAGVTVVRTMPDDTVVEMQLDGRSAVLALSHDPKLDDLALMDALKTPAFYVGAIGSRKHSADRRERMKLFGVTDQELNNLKGPIGLFIGSQTPPELAVSVLAEIIACKHRVDLPTATVATGKQLQEKKLAECVLYS